MKTGRKPATPCPDGLDADVWKEWHQVLHLEDAAWLADFNSIKHGSRATKGQIIEAIMRKNVQLMSKEEFEALNKSIQTRNDYVYNTRLAAWMLVPTNS